jgi:hypothetical protein
MPTLEESFQTAKAAAASAQEESEHPDSTDKCDAEGSVVQATEQTATSIPAVAALDSSLAPYLNQIALKRQFIAVRVGYASSHGGGGSAAAGVTTVRNAIFLSWEDARHFVEFASSSPAMEDGGLASAKRGAITVPYHSNVEWRAFDSLERAEVGSRVFCVLFLPMICANMSLCWPTCRLI